MSSSAATISEVGRPSPWRLVYPDAWWRLDLVGLRDPALAEVETALKDG